MIQDSNDNEIIEIDESKFGKGKYNKGHLVEKRNNKKEYSFFRR